MKVPQALSAIRNEIVGGNLAAEMDVKPSERFEQAWRVTIVHPKLIGPPERDVDLSYLLIILKGSSIHHTRHIDIDIDEHVREDVDRATGQIYRIKGRRTETTTDVYEIPIEGEIRYEPKRQAR